MDIDSVSGYNIIVKLHSEEHFTRSCTIYTNKEPQEINALFEYCGLLSMAGLRVKAIKYCRTELDCGLRDAKDFVLDAHASKKPRLGTSNMEGAYDRPVTDPDPF
jgi:ribosomal protein L7/L12